MKNFRMMGVQIFRGDSQKTNIIGGLPKKRELRQFAEVGGALGKKRGWCF